MDSAALFKGDLCLQQKQAFTFLPLIALVPRDKALGLIRIARPARKRKAGFVPRPATLKCSWIAVLPRSARHSPGRRTSSSDRLLFATSCTSWNAAVV